MSGYFISSDQARARRSSDVVATVFGALLILWAWLHADRISAFEDAIIDLAQSLPSWFDALYGIGYGIGFLYVVGLVVAVVAGRGERSELMRDVLAALGVAIAVSALLALAGDGVAIFHQELPGSGPEPAFPVVRVALVAAAILVSSPSLARPVRRLGWTVLVLVGISGIGLGYGMPSDVLGALGVGLVAAGGVLLVVGSPRGYPDIDSVAAGLRDLGIEVVNLTVQPAQSWGVRSLRGSTRDGELVDIKALGRDATDSQWLARFWHTLWYRDRGRVFAASRRAGVEHEALMMELAARRGVRVESVLAVGVIGDDDLALLATSRSGDPAEVDGLGIDDLAAMWREVRALHAIGMAHGSLGLESFRPTEAGPVVANLAAASVDSDSPAIHLDTASLLFESSMVVGTSEAVRIACEVLGHDAVGAALPYLQVPGLSRSQRKRFPKPKPVLAELREAIVDETGVDPPEPAKLRRVRPTDLIMPTLSLVAAWALIGLLSDIDFVAVWDVVQDADWGWILVGFLVGQTVFFPEATGMYFAVGYALPLRPLTILQVSVKWIGLAVPSAAGRIAMNTVFLRKYGVSPTVALTQGAIDGLSGFVVEALVLVVALLAYDDLSIDLETPELNWALILGVVIFIIVATVTVVLRIQRLRTLIVPPVVEGGRLVWDVLREPKRAFGLLGSNLVARTILGIVLWFVLAAIGAPLPLVSCIVITVATNLLAGLVPIPGGIGVAEAVLTSFLVLFGLSSEEAFAAAVVFRVVTFYIPAAEGFFAMRWLETNGYV